MKKHRTIQNRSETELVEKKSRFIATAMPVGDEEGALALIAELKKAHYNASHNVYAYIIGENAETQRFSDDGEPNGTAGMPVLNVMKNEGIVNAVVVVTRYFGGTLLGAGGLVRAYSKAAKQGLDAAVIIEKIPHTLAGITVAYTLSGKTQYALINSNFAILDTSYTSDVTFLVPVEEGRGEELQTLLNDTTNANVCVDWQNAVYCAVINGKLQIFD